MKLRKTSNLHPKMLATVSASLALAGFATAAPYDMSTGNFLEDFADIATWTNANTESFTGVAVNTTGTVPEATRITTNTSSAFSTGTSGGVQKGTQAIILLSTGGTDNTSSAALDLSLNFTGRDAGNLSFDAASVANTTGDRNGTLRVYYTTNGTTWTELTGVSLPFTATNNVASSAAVNVPLPAALDGAANAVLRFYYHNGAGGGSGTPAGSRPKISIDNLSVTSSGAGDVTPPAVSTLTPTDNATGVSTLTDLTIAFNEPVVKGTGNITVLNGVTPVATIDVTTAAVAITGSTATVTLPAPLSGSTAYSVNIAGTAFKDIAGNSYAGISNATDWNFTTGASDVTPPAIVTRFPVDDATAIHPASNLVLTFDEDIVAGTGNILLKKASDNSTVETIAIGGPRTTISGATLTIDPTAPLDFSAGYYIEAPAGVVKDTTGNNAAAITGSAAWNFTTRATPAVVISQYYDGTTASNRYIELKNLTGSPVDLTGYRITVWSDTPPSDNEGWKSGTNTTDREVDLTGNTIPANGYFLISTPSPSLPAYAAVAADLKSTETEEATFFNGDDSVVLYDGATNALSNIADAVSFAANNGNDTSFYRLTNDVGFDFAAGSSILGFTSVWSTKTLAEVASAVPTDAWYLAASALPESLSISFNNTSFSEAAGAAASTATVTRTGPTGSAIFLNITVSDETEVSVTTPVTLPANQASTTFPLNAVNDTLKDGSKTVTILVESDDYIPATGQVTVTDDGADQPIPVVINEVDSDSNAATDTAEFIELYNTSASQVSLDGHVIVLYNGNLAGEPSYRVIDLTGHVIPANDYFVIGSTGVANVDLEITATEWIQNGADAVVLRAGAPTEFPTDTPVTTADVAVVDAVVYDTSDADDTGLLAALTPGQPQVDEGQGGNAETNAIARVPDGGAPLVTGSYAAQAPSPGATNGTGGGGDFGTWATATGATGGPTGDPDKDGKDNSYEYAFGLNPTSASSANPFVTMPDKTTGKFRFTRRTPALSGLDYKVFTSTTLAPPFIEDTGATLSVISTTGDVQTVEVTISASLLAAPKLMIWVESE